MAGHRGVLEQFYERFGEGDLEGAAAMFAAGIRITDPGMGTVDGLEALYEYLRGLKEAVPDARAIVERAFEVDDTVIIEGRFTGTAPPAGHPASAGVPGVQVDLVFADFALIRDGQIVEYRTYYDQVSLLKQLGHSA